MIVQDMINWINDEPVRVKTSPNFENLVMTLNRVQKGTGQIELIDKHGFQYFTFANRVQFLMPEAIQEIFTEGDKISQYFKLKDGDLV